MIAAASEAEKDVPRNGTEVASCIYACASVARTSGRQECAEKRHKG